MTLGSLAMRKTEMVEFTVVDIPNSGYNGIIGRPTLVAFQAVVSMAHLKMKFPVEGGVGKICGNQLSSKECYVKVSKRINENRHEAAEDTSWRKRGRKMGAKPHNQEEMLLLNEAGKDPEGPPSISTWDMIMTIELHPGKPGSITKVGADLEPHVREELILCLQRNAHVFAFSTTDLEGIDPKVAEHRLNEDPDIKPV